MQWTGTGTIPAGVLRNHALSERLRFSALAQTLMTRWVRPESDFGKRRGETYNVKRVQQLTAATRISELENVPAASPSISIVAVSVSLWGLKMEETEMLETLNEFNIRSMNQRLLRNNIRLTVDNLITETMTGSVNKFIPTVGGGVFDTDGTPSTVADANLDVTMLQVIKDDLASRNVPPFDNGRYVAVLSTKAARGVVNDTLAKEWLAPTSRIPFERGSVGADEGFPVGETPAAEFIGTIDNIDIWRTNNTAVLGQTAVYGQGLVFGDDPCVLVEALTPELRADPATELGTKRQVGWVGIFDAGLPWPEASLARVTHITSA